MEKSPHSCVAMAKCRVPGHLEPGCGFSYNPTKVMTELSSDDRCGGYGNRL